MVFTHTLPRSFAVISIVLTIAPVLLLSACKNTDPPPHKAVTDMKQFMSWVIDPAAVALWASFGTQELARAHKARSPELKTQKVAIYLQVWLNLPLFSAYCHQYAAKRLLKIAGVWPISCC